MKYKKYKGWKQWKLCRIEVEVLYGWLRIDFRLLNNQKGRQDGTRHTVKLKCKDLKSKEEKNGNC